MSTKGYFRQCFPQECNAMIRRLEHDYRKTFGCSKLLLVWKALGQAYLFPHEKGKP